MQSEITSTAPPAEAAEQPPPEVEPFFDGSNPEEAAYASRTTRSRAHFGRARRFLPGGVAKGAYYHQPYPLYLESAKGAYVTTLDGQRLLDFRGHHTAAILGHGHPAVLDAVRAQEERAIAPGGPTEVEFRLASELTRRVPSVERVRFTSSGTEAVAHAIRLARGWTGRTKIAKFEGGFHGSADAVQVSVAPPLHLAGPADAPLPVPNVRGLAPSVTEEVVVLPYHQPKAVARLLERHRSELAAVLFDPRAGILPIDPEFVRFLRRLTEDLDLLLVLDEVVSFRLGPGGLQGRCGIRPDLTIFGKIIGGGFPIGAFGGRADLMDLLDNTQGLPGFSHSGTFNGHPVALAAGLATLEHLTPSVFAHLATLGESVHSGCNALFARLGTPAQAVSDGSLFSLHFTQERICDYRALQTADRALVQRVYLGLLAEDVLVAPGLVMNAIAAPMHQSHVQTLLGALERTLRRLDRQDAPGPDETPSRNGTTRTGLGLSMSRRQPGAHTLP